MTFGTTDNCLNGVFLEDLHESIIRSTRNDRGHNHDADLQELARLAKSMARLLGISSSPAANPDKPSRNHSGSNTLTIASNDRSISSHLKQVQRRFTQQATLIRLFLFNENCCITRWFRQVRMRSHLTPAMDAIFSSITPGSNNLRRSVRTCRSLEIGRRKFGRFYIKTKWTLKLSWWAWWTQ